MEGIRKERLRLRIERIERDGTVAEPLIEDRSLICRQHEARQQVGDEKPCRDADHAEYKQMFVFHMHHFALTTGGTVYLRSRISAPGIYTRNQSMKLPNGAGSQLDSWPAGAVFWM